jgi:brefeldin A-resistance guanine nucleotide exchange factor 1
LYSTLVVLNPTQPQVLEEFTNTFDFEGLSFDAGLRVFLESFKLPGEAQKIDRIINCE